MSSLVELERYIEKPIEELTAVLDIITARADDDIDVKKRDELLAKAEGISGKSIDLGLWLHFFANDAVGELAVSDQSCCRTLSLKTSHPFASLDVDLICSAQATTPP